MMVTDRLLQLMPFGRGNMSKSWWQAGKTWNGSVLSDILCLKILHTYQVSHHKSAWETHDMHLAVGHQVWEALCY